MKKMLGITFLSLLLAACAGQGEMERAKALYDKYDAHCRAHAKEVSAEMDVEARYHECMNYFIGTDPLCPYCKVDHHMKH
ncbi:MAG: hypothetical protein SCI25_02130 [Desulfuromonadales bacterium]|nr:hypothetical protein [Desulfuromonadales bacterium]